MYKAPFIFRQFCSKDSQLSLVSAINSDQFFKQCFQAVFHHGLFLNLRKNFTDLVRAGRTKVNIYLPYRGAISFYVIFCWTRSNFFAGSCQHGFLKNFPIKLLLSRKVKFQIH